MILNVHSDASYLSAPKACSRAGGYFFLGSIPQDTKPIFINGVIHIACTILKLVAALVAEAEFGALFPATTNTHLHQQHHHCGKSQKHDQSTTVAGKGDAIFLVFQQQSPKTILFPLPSWSRVLRQLSIVSSHHHHPSTNLPILSAHE
jgi:hypothetical protein